MCQAPCWGHQKQGLIQSHHRFSSCSHNIGSKTEAEKCSPLNENMETQLWTQNTTYEVGAEELG